MALSRLYTFTSGTTIRSSEVNAEFNQILNSALALISPLTGTLNANNNQVTNLRVENVTATPSGAQAGRVVFHTAKAELQVMDGTGVRHVPTMATPSQGDLLVATDSGAWGRVTLGATGQFLQANATTRVPEWVTIATGSLSTQSAYILSSTGTWNPGTINATSTATTSLTVTGAQVGDACFPGLSTFTTVTAASLSARVVATNTVLAVIENITNNQITVGSGTLRVVVMRF